MDRRNRLLLLWGLTVLVCMSAGAARAGDFEVRAGYYFDAEDAFVGAGWLTDLGDSDHWFFNPNFEYVFVSDGDLMTLNGDVHYDFHSSEGWSFWAGGGPALIWIDIDEEDDTELGLNLIVGAGKERGEIRPFFQGKVIIADNSEAVIGGGIRF